MLGFVGVYILPIFYLVRRLLDLGTDSFVQTEFLGDNYGTFIHIFTRAEIGGVPVSLICWPALWRYFCQSDMLGFVGVLLSV